MLVIYVVIHLYVAHVDMNQFLTINCVYCDTRSDMDISVELTDLKCTNFITLILDNIALVSNV